jgi:hypothetical protein
MIVAHQHEPAAEGVQRGLQLRHNDEVKAEGRLVEQEQCRGQHGDEDARQRGAQSDRGHGVLGVAERAQCDVAARASDGAGGQVGLDPVGHGDADDGTRSRTRSTRCTSVVYQYQRRQG